jgi:hypothetical protein
MESRGPITTELRETIRSLAIDDSVLTIGGDDFHRICDAIDAVHAGLERENAELRERVAALDNQADSMHDGWVRLPLDRDGEPIRIGDVMENIVCPSVHREVTGVGVECFYGWDDGNGRYSQFDVNCYRHHRAPTVEDVLREMHAELDEVTALYVGEAIDSDERDRDEARIFAEYAKRLTLAGDAE